MESRWSTSHFDLKILFCIINGKLSNLRKFTLINVVSTISGIVFFMFFSPVIRISPDIIPTTQTVKYTRSVEEKKTTKTNKSVQTVYRDSSAQTKPWQPEDVIIPEGSDLEILKIQFLK